MLSPIQFNLVVILSFSCQPATCSLRQTWFLCGFLFSNQAVSSESPDFEKRARRQPHFLERSKQPHLSGQINTHGEKTAPATTPWSSSTNRCWRPSATDKGGDVGHALPSSPVRRFLKDAKTPAKLSLQPGGDQEVVHSLRRFHSAGDSLGTLLHLETGNCYRWSRSPSARERDSPSSCSASLKASFLQTQTPSLQDCKQSASSSGSALHEGDTAELWQDEHQAAYLIKSDFLDLGVLPTRSPTMTSWSSTRDEMHSWHLRCLQAASSVLLSIGYTSEDLLNDLEKKISSPQLSQKACEASSFPSIKDL